VELFTYCLMPNPWHLVVRPAADGELSEFMRWLTVTHAQRWHAHRRTAGTGHLYQGRFKSFPVEGDERHFLAVCRYVERNALRAGLCGAAEDWRWGGLWRRVQSTGAGGAGVSDVEPGGPRLARWPVGIPDDWVARVNAAQTAAEEAAVRRCVAKGRPFGTATYEAWTREALGLEASFRERGRPRKGAGEVRGERK
jgi:putative transposase